MTAYRLVYHGIGGRTVRELIEDSQMSRDEFLTWAAFFHLEPRGDERLDFHIARLMGMYVNMNQPKGKSKTNPSRFLPRWTYRPKRVMSPEEMREAARGHLGLKDKEQTT